MSKKELEIECSRYYHWLFTIGGVKREYVHGKYTGEPYHPNSKTRISNEELDKILSQYKNK